MSEAVKNEKEGMIWYGTCTYWTDDWEALGESKGIPVCPECGSSGFEITVEDWEGGILKHEADGHAGYGKFIRSLKGKCHGSAAMFPQLWEDFQKQEAS